MYSALFVKAFAISGVGLFVFFLFLASPVCVMATGFAVCLVFNFNSYMIQIATDNRWASVLDAVVTAMCLFPKPKTGWKNNLIETTHQFIL